MNIDIAQLKEVVIAQSVAQLVDQFSNESEIAKAVEKKAVNLIEAIVEARVKAVLKTGLKELIFKKTNVYGEPKGEDRTMCEYVDDAIQAHLVHPVDSQGVNCTQDHYSKRDTRLQWIVKQQVEKDIAASVVAAAKAFNAEIAKTVSGVVAEKIQEVVARLKP